MEVANTFTAVGNGSVLPVDHNQTFRYSVSGTFVGTVVLEESETGGQTWQPLASYTSPRGGVLLTEFRQGGTKRYRFRCSAFTSGSVVTALMNAEGGVTPALGEVIVLGKDYPTVRECLEAALSREQWYEVGASVSAGKTVSKTAGSTSFVVSAGTYALSDDMRNWYISADVAGTPFNNCKWYPVDYLNGTATIFAGVAAQETLAGGQLKFARPKVTTIVLANRSITESFRIHAKSACLKFQDGALEGSAGQVSEQVDSGYLEWNNVRLQSTTGVLFTDSGTPYSAPVTTKRWVDVYAKNSGGLDGNFLKAGTQEVFGGHYEGVNHIWTGLNTTKGKVVVLNAQAKSTSLLIGAAPSAYLVKPAPYSRISDCVIEANCAADPNVTFEFLENDGSVANGAIFENCTFRVSRMGSGNNTIKLIQASGTVGTVLKFKNCHWVIDDDVGVTAVTRFYLIATNVNITLENCTFPKNFAFTDAIVAGTVTITHVNNNVQQTITYAASITPNPHLGDVMTVTLTGALTMGVPVNPIKGHRVTFVLVQGGAGAFATTWNAVFRKQADGAAGATGTKGTITFEYDGTVWLQVGAALAYF